MRRYYTRACNFYYGSKSKSLVKEKKTLPLNGNNEISFDKIEIISMSAEQDATTAKVEDVKKKKSNKTNDNDDVIKIDEDNLDNQDENDTKEN